MRVAVVGLGLIGGSLAQALHPGHDVVGTDVSAGTREQAAAWGLEVTDDTETACGGADLVVLAASVPVNDTLLAMLPRGALVTDVGSVKTPIVSRWHSLDDPPALVPGHPMAGAEHAGWAAARSDLVDGARWALCPGPWSSARQWLDVCELVLGLGAVVVPAEPAAHDLAAASISHAPHVVAAALAAGATSPLARSLAAGSFRDLTRVTASPPPRTAEFCFANRAATSQALRTVVDHLHATLDALDTGDADGLVRLLEAGHAARDELDRARTTTRDDTWELHVDDPRWSTELYEIASAGGLVVGATRTASGALLDVRRPA